MVDILKASVRDTLCRKEVEKLSEIMATFDVMMECSCRVGNVARKCMADQLKRTIDA